MPPHLTAEPDDGYGCGHAPDASEEVVAPSAAPAARIDEWSKREGHMVLGTEPGHLTIVPHENGRTDGQMPGPRRPHGPEVRERWRHIIEQGRRGVSQLVIPPLAHEVDGDGNPRLGISPFLRDLQSFLGSREYRRMGGVLQMLPAMAGTPSDPMTNRRSHGYDTASVATGICIGLGLDVDLGGAAAISHDLGHPPFGHSGEYALTPHFGQLPNHQGKSFNHALAGHRKAHRDHRFHPDMAEVIGWHSWQLPRGSRPECDVVSLADRIAYVGSDLMDFVKSGQVAWNDLPHVLGSVFEFAKITAEEFDAMTGSPDRYELMKHRIYDAFVEDVVAQGWTTGWVGLSPHGAQVLSALRSFNAGHLFEHAAHKAWQRKVTDTVEHLGEVLYQDFETSRVFADVDRSRPLSDERRRKHVIGRLLQMTDREAAYLAQELLHVDPRLLLVGPAAHEPTRTTVDLSASRTSGSRTLRRVTAPAQPSTARGGDRLPALDALLARVPLDLGGGEVGMVDVTAALHALDIARQVIEPSSAIRAPAEKDMARHVWVDVADDRRRLLLPGPTDEGHHDRVRSIQASVGAMVHRALMANSGMRPAAASWSSSRVEGLRALDAQVRRALDASDGADLARLRPREAGMVAEEARARFDVAAETALRRYAHTFALGGAAPARTEEFATVMRPFGPVGAVR